MRDLSYWERINLIKLLTDGHLHPGERKRMTVIKLCLEEKMSVPEVSQITETPEATIQNWLEAFQKGGFLALLSSHRALDKKTLPLELKSLHFFYSLLPPQS